MVPVRRTQTWLPDIFNDFFDNTWMEKTNATAPAINIRETETNYEIEVAAPGMTREDFTIKIENNNQLVVSMEKKHEQKEDKKEEGRYLRREFSYTRFQQAMILPDDVVKEKIQARMEHGVLTIDIPKQTDERLKSNNKKSRIVSGIFYYKYSLISCNSTNLFTIA